MSMMNTLFVIETNNTFDGFNGKIHVKYVGNGLVEFLTVIEKETIKVTKTTKEAKDFIRTIDGGIKSVKKYKTPFLHVV
jgi:hypothetical protein